MLLPRRQQLNARQRDADGRPERIRLAASGSPDNSSQGGGDPLSSRGAMARRSKNRRGVNALDPHMGGANEFSIQRCNTNCALPAIGRCCNAT